MKRLSKVVSVIVLLFVLSGCFEKDFDSNAIVLRGAKDLNFSAGESKAVTAELPQIEGLKLTAICRDPALEAQISEDNTLMLSCGTAGDYILTLRLEAKGYRTKETRYPVSVTTQPMNITAVWEDGKELGLTELLTLCIGDEKTLVFSGAPENAEYNIQSADPTIAAVEQESNGIKLTAIAPGKTTLQLDITSAGYEPFSVEFPVEVDKLAALLDLAKQSVSGTTLDTLKVTCLAFQPGGHLIASSNDPAVSAKVEANIIQISSTKAGDFSVTVSCEAEGFHTATQTIKATFTMPQVPLSLPSSISLALGQTKDVTVTGLPNGAAIFASINNKNIAVQNSNAVLSIEGKAVGTANITLTASCAGYADSRVTLPVTVNATSYSSSSKYAEYVKEIIDLVNEERTSRGLSALTYLPDLDGACQVRAKEASIVWDHTRPDGRSWETVLKDMGYAYHAAGENLLDANVLNASSAVEAWMDSPGHRENILRPNFTGVCVGIVQEADGDYYYAQLFITKE